VRYGGGRLGAVATTTTGSCGGAKLLPVWRWHGQWGIKKLDVMRAGYNGDSAGVGCRVLRRVS